VMRYLSTAAVVLSLTAMPVMFGCDRTVSHEDSQQTEPNGTVKSTDTTVKQDSNGNTITDKTTTTDKPATNGQ
jgi:hypothetical protein